jgi:mRNA interferase RelE/StbE
MSYTLSFSQKAYKQFSKLDKYTQKRIQEYMNKYVAGSEDPRQKGKPLSENLAGYHRYRIGDYRVICEINEGVCEIVAVAVGHRSRIYEPPYSTR